jgi:hypothetical protein
MTEHLYDADKVEQLTLRYGRTSSTEQKERIKEQILEETIGTAFDEKNSKEPQFFSGVPRLVALIKAHQEYDDPDQPFDDPHLLEHLEREIELMGSGKRTPIAEFDQMPFPYASHTKLLALCERSDERSVTHYFRLRAFQAAGVFSDADLPKIRGGDDAELTEKEVEYLDSM